MKKVQKSEQNSFKVTWRDLAKKNALRNKNSAVQQQGDDQNKVNLSSLRSLIYDTLSSKTQQNLVGSQVPILKEISTTISSSKTKSIST